MRKQFDRIQASRQPRAFWTRPDASRPCPVCGALERRVISTRMQHRFDMRTVICSGCALVYTDPPPRRELYNRFYVEAYSTYYGRIAAPAPASSGAKPPARVQWQLLQIDAVKPICGSRILEIGPGGGSFLWWAAQRGADATGLEPSEAFAEALRSAGFKVIQGTLEDCDRSALGRHDIVVLLHVLEHFREPAKALAAIRELLAPDGIVVIEVPNILKPFRSLDRYFLRYVHLSQFSPETLRFLLSKCGFETLTSDEGGNDWRNPQSLFAIARPPTQPFSSARPLENPLQVIDALARYRRMWRSYGAIRWRLWRIAIALRSAARRAARRLLGDASIKELSRSLAERTIAAAALLAISPVLLLIAVAVRVKTGPPVLFRQWRMGRNGRPFRLVKFRSMRTGAPGTPITASGDGRITAVGRVLRKYKLDELPQLWNVLRGEMRFIGPRPEAPQFVDLESGIWKAVLAVPPGITDLASLRYRDEERVLAGHSCPERYYRETILPAKLRLNLEYLERRSFASDLKLLWLTALYSFLPAKFDPARVLQRLGASDPLVR